MIEYALRKHFPDLPETTGPRDYARNYLEKLIQVPFRIPALGETETRIYVTLLLTGAEIGDDDVSYARLIDVARESLKRPWESAGLDAATVKAALGEKADKAHNALALSDLLVEWKSSETIRDWARVQPFLTGVDLRPYLFVTKDKKDYFGPVSVLGHLAAVVEKLFGGKMSVQAYEAELKQLVQPEADKVFEAVRTKIMGSGAFETMPPGVDGLVVLVNYSMVIYVGDVDVLRPEKF